MTIFKKNVLATLIILAGLGTAVGAYAHNISDTSSRGTIFCNTTMPDGSINNSGC